jgi:restriction system protein
VTQVVADARVPPYDKMLWPTLQAIKELGNSGSNQEIEDKAIEIAEYTDAQLGALHGEGPQTEIRYRMAWARTYLKAVGALENSSRGIWSITDYGESLKEVDMAGIPARVRAMSAQRRRSSQPVDLKEIEPSNAVVQAADVKRIFTSTVFEAWRDNLLEIVQAMAPGSFEKLCQRVLRESGFTRVEVTGRSGG